VARFAARSAFRVRFHVDSFEQIRPEDFLEDGVHPHRRLDVAPLADMVEMVPVVDHEGHRELHRLDVLDLSIRFLPSYWAPRR